MLRPATGLRVFLAITLILQSSLPSTAQAGELFGRIKRLVKESTYQGKQPATGEDCAMEELAQNIDWLEHHIDTYGSIVAKQPDIWGEARLTKHRDEYERQMLEELGSFEDSINASINQSDASFLAQAIALSNAAGESPGFSAVPGNPMAGTPATTSIQSLLPSGSTDTTASGSGTAERAVTLEPTVMLDQMSRYINHLHELRRRNEGDDTSDSPGYALNLVRMPVSVLPGKLTREGFGGEITITAEPVLTDDLLPTTFRNLVINDLAALLGLPLVRVAEQLENIRNASKQSEEYKKRQKEIIENICEIEEAVKVTQSQIDSYEQLQMAAIFFSTQKKIALPMWQEMSFSQSPSLEMFEGRGELVETPRPNRGSIKVARFVDEIATERLPEGDKWKAILSKLKEAGKPEPAGEAESSGSEPDGEKPASDNAMLQEGPLDEPLPALGVWQTDQNSSVDVKEKQFSDAVDAFVAEARSIPKEKKASKENQERLRIELDRLNDELTSLLEDLGDIGNQIQSVATLNTPSGRGRSARRPLPSTQVAPVFGKECLIKIAESFSDSYQGRNVRWAGFKDRMDRRGRPQEARVNLIDLRNWLRDELAAAHELLCQPGNVELFYTFAKPDSGLADVIRKNHVAGKAPQSAGFANQYDVCQYRTAFFTQLLGLDTEPQAGCSQCREAQALHCLAWAIVVESALLNERLNEDIRKTTVSRECDNVNCYAGRKLSFFLPDKVLETEAPVVRPQGVAMADAPMNSIEGGRGFLQGEFQEATKAFQDYVRCRWPIHVFALDPVSQDQNVAEASARQRELQFALALGFSTGRIGGNSLTQYSRELQTNLETVSLNRTIAGFGHGSDTFGWRFRPRVQALPVPGTFGSLRETLMGTSRDYDLNHRQIEDGMRECVAVVLMPSFVPYCDFHIRSNWMKLTNPKNSALTMKDTLRLSRSITTMRNCRAQCVKCEHLYRPLELQRMLKRVDQLDRELPLQSERVQVPYENTLGGFEMFNTGVTDLAPELIGWYGAPGVVVGSTAFSCPAAALAASSSSSGGTGTTAALPACTSGCAVSTNTSPVTVNNAATAAAASTTMQAATTTAAAGDCNANGTTLFLVGDNFSVHDTRVIAGGVCIDSVRLVSRDIMRVTIPSCVNTVEVDGEEYVAVYAATPYGVTNHLHVPVHSRAATTTERSAIAEEVTRQIDALGIPQPLARITPSLATRLEMTATPTQAGPNNYELTPNQAANVQLAVGSDPRFNGLEVTLHAVVRSSDGQLMSNAIEVREGGTFQPSMGSVTIPALGTPPEVGMDSKLHEELERILQPGHFQNGNTVDLEIRYYLTLQGQEFWQGTELRSVVQLRITRPSEARPAVSPTPATETGNGGSSTRWTPPADPSTVQFQSRSSVLATPAAWNEPVEQPRRLPSTRVPARFAQFGESVGDATPSFEQFGDRLDRIEAAVGNLQQPSQPQPIVLPAPQTSTIEVRVVSPPTAPVSRHEYFNAQNHPIISQTATRLGERWRNLRDNLPGQ